MELVRNCSEIALKLLGYFSKNDSEMTLKWLWNDSETALKLLWNWYGTALELHWNYSETALELLCICYGIGIELLWKRSETAPELLRNCSEIALKLLCNDSEIALKWFWIWYGMAEELRPNCSETALELLWIWCGEARRGAERRGEARTDSVESFRLFNSKAINRGIVEMWSSFLTRRSAGARAHVYASLLLTTDTNGCRTPRSLWRRCVAWPCVTWPASLDQWPMSHMGPLRPAYLWKMYFDIPIGMRRFMGAQ